MDKYINTSGFDMNSFDADRVAFRESQEKAAQAQSPEAVNSRAMYEAKLKREKEEREHAIAREEAIANDNRERREIRERNERERKQYEESKREQYIAETNAKRKAIKAAYERYQKHNVFYKMFHKSVYKMDPYKTMSVEQIDELYGGKSR